MGHGAMVMSEGYTPSEIDDFEISDTATSEIDEESQCIIIDIIDGLYFVIIFRNQKKLYTAHSSPGSNK